MTDKPNGGGESANAEHNAEARAATIRTAFNEIYEIEKEIDRAIETHVRPLKDARSKAWRNVKNDTNIAQKVLKAEYRPYAMARDAQEFADEDDGDKLLDDLKEAHQALHQDETVDWVAVIEATKPAQQNFGG